MFHLSTLAKAALSSSIFVSRKCIYKSALQASLERDGEGSSLFRKEQSDSLFPMALYSRAAPGTTLLTSKPAHQSSGRLVSPSSCQRQFTMVQKDAGSASVTV